MIVSEDEAKTKWCPFARQMVTIESGGGAITGAVAVGSANRFEGGKGSLCLGSGCMAWRRADALDTKIGYCGFAQVLHLPA